MNENAKAVDAILKVIDRYVDKRLKEASFDVTTQGRIVEILGSDKYKVQIKGADYSVPCCTGQKFNVGDVVLVLNVQNDAKRKYIIGKG